MKVFQQSKKSVLYKCKVLLFLGCQDTCKTIKIHSLPACGACPLHPWVDELYTHWRSLLNRPASPWGSAFSAAELKAQLSPFRRHSGNALAPLLESVCQLRVQTYSSHGRAGARGFWWFYSI